MKFSLALALAAFLGFGAVSTVFAQMPWAALPTRVVGTAVLATKTDHAIASPSVLKAKVAARLLSGRPPPCSFHKRPPGLSIPRRLSAPHEVSRRRTPQPNRHGSSKYPLRE